MEKTIKTIDCTPTWAFAAHQQEQKDFKAMDAIGQTCSLIQESYDNIGDAYHICANTKGMDTDLLEAIDSVSIALSNLHEKFQAIR
jgi:hypothetical protein